MIFFSVWAWFILIAYLGLWLVVVWRRLQGDKNVTQPQLLTVSEHEAVVFHGAQPKTLPGLLLIASSFFWGTVGIVIAYGAIGMLRDLQLSVWSPMGVIILAEIAIGLVFVAWCVWNAFGQRGIVVDRQARTVTTWWGLFAPIGRKAFSAKDFTAVGVHKKKKRFSVCLEGKGRSVLVDNTICRTHEAARQLATQLAEVGGWELRDDAQI
jgi:hypothetical protein